MSGEATILHADLDAFFASVEQRDDARLRGRPVIVGGGVVLACSYEAKRRGVRTAMNGQQA
ncbi:MAG TPA: DNA polymerase IV, partial [Gaiella sp.]